MKDQDDKEKTLCGVSIIMKMIGKKWTIFILHALCERTKRFGELQRELHTISPRTLSMRLRELEDDGIVKKTIFASVPPHVEYSLTAKGKSLKTLIEQMKRWGESQSASARDDSFATLTTQYK